ncbi:MAG: EamA family transporter [Burkholderiales bacterium]
MPPGPRPRPAKVRASSAYPLGPPLTSHVRLSLRDLAIVLAIVVIWGFAFVPMRWALETVPPFALAALRFLCAAVPAVFLVRRPRVAWRWLVAYGFAIGVFQFGLLFLGMKLGMPAGLSSLVIQTQVFFTIGLAGWLLHDRLTRHSLIGAAIASTGILVLAWHKVALGATATVVGFLLVVAAAFSWAVGNVIAKRAAGPPQGARAPSGGSEAVPTASVGAVTRAAGPPRGARASSGGRAAVPAARVGAAHPAAAGADVDMLGMVVWSSLAAPLPLALASWIFEGGPAAWAAVVNMTWVPWACVLFMAYFATLFGLARWNALLHRYPTAVIAPFALLIPVSGLVSGAAFLGEGLAPIQFAGVALVLAGLAWNVLGAQARAWLAAYLD